MDLSEDFSFTSQQMRQFLAEMGEQCRGTGEVYEIAIYGGSALMLSFDYREGTRDIDYIPVSGAAHEIAEMGDQAAEKIDIPKGLLRDDVSVFVSDAAKYVAYGEFPPAAERVEGEGYLRVFVAAPEYILAMKVMAMRSSVETQDLRDVWEMCDVCGVTTLDEAVELVREFYPTKRVPKRNLLILEDVFADKAAGKKYSAALGW